MDHYADDLAAVTAHLDLWERRPEKEARLAAAPASVMPRWSCLASWAMA